MRALAGFAGRRTRSFDLDTLTDLTIPISTPSSCQPKYAPRRKAARRNSPIDAN